MELRELAENVNRSNSLSELRDNLNELETAVSVFRTYGIPETEMGTYVDTGNLPTFGGANMVDMMDMLGVVSWDKDSYLIEGEGSIGNRWEVIPREENA